MAMKSKRLCTVRPDCRVEEVLIAKNETVSGSEELLWRTDVYATSTLKGTAEKHVGQWTTLGSLDLCRQAFPQILDDIEEGCGQWGKKAYISAVIRTPVD